MHPQLFKRQGGKMSETVQLRVGYANCSDILPNWSDMRNRFVYTTLYETSRKNV